MSYTKRIQSLWNEDSGQNLTEILTDILELIDEAYSKGERIPVDLEVEILLNANYALGFGTKPTEARHLLDLLHFILKNYDRNLTGLDVTSMQLHRLACTLIGAIISNISSNLENISQIVQIENNGHTPANRINHVTDVMIQFIGYGDFNKWQLELLSFIVTLSLLQQDLGIKYTLTSKQSQLLHSVINRFDTESEIWVDWKEDWLEKSDYYRFTTLMITNTSSSEEKWIDEMTKLLNL